MATVPADDPLKTYPPLRLSPEEIAWLVNRVDQGNTRYPKLNARFSTESKPIAVAIIMVESGGNVFALNKIPPDLSYGLAQINMLGDKGPQRREQWGLKSNIELYQADLNVAIMAQLSTSGADFKAWTSYVTKAYLPHMAAARAALKAPKDPSGRLKTPEQTDAANNQSAWERMIAWIQKQMLRVAGFVGGGVLLILAIVLYVRSAK